MILKHITAAIEQFWKCLLLELLKDEAPLEQYTYSYVILCCKFRNICLLSNFQKLLCALKNEFTFLELLLRVFTLDNENNRI